MKNTSSNKFVLNCLGCLGLLANQVQLLSVVRQNIIILAASFVVACGQVDMVETLTQSSSLAPASDSRAIVVDVTSTLSSGSYGTGQVIPVVVTFSRTLTTTGSPRILLNTSPARYANYFSGSGTTSLTFYYTVQAGDASAILDYTSTTSLEKNSGTLIDSDGKTALTNFSAPGVPFSLSHNRNIRIDTTAPTVPTGLALSSPSSSPDRDNTPTIAVSGVVSGDTVKLYSDITCATEVASGIASGTSINLTAFTLFDGTYNFYAKSIDAANNASSCSTDTFAYILERQFSFISGDKKASRNGVEGKASHGTKGVAAASNFPGGRQSAAVWTDGSGNLWLFGGYLKNSNYMNDLWKYDVSTGLWTWISGPNSSAGAVENFGTLGVASASNLPPPRGGGTTGGSGGVFTTIGDGTASWVDNSGNFWIFGGYGKIGSSYGFLNDLWKFDVSTSQWTWMGGANSIDSAATYGVKGTPSTSNIPGARTPATYWKDGSGNFWVFGGRIAGTNTYNDLWRYNPSTGEWTWMKGTNTANGATVKTTLGSGDATTTPSSRLSTHGAYDGNGNLWLFGGSSLWEYYNDLWRYNVASNTWIWEAGANAFSDTASPASYGTIQVENVSNIPGARGSGKMQYDGAGYLWLSFGAGYTETEFGNLSDTWKFNLSNNRWTWVSGSKIANTPGTC